MLTKSLQQGKQTNEQTKKTPVQMGRDKNKSAKYSETVQSTRGDG